MNKKIQAYNTTIEILEESVGSSEHVICKIKVRAEGIEISSMNVCYYDKIVVYPPKGVELDYATKSIICEILTEEFSDYIEHHERISTSRLITLPIDLNINHPDRADEHLCDYFKKQGITVVSFDSEYIILKVTNSKHTKLSISLMYGEACDYMHMKYSEGGE